MPENGRLIAACGLDCTDCDMRQAATNPELQRKFVIWFKEKRGRAVVPPVAGLAVDREEPLQDLLLGLPRVGHRRVPRPHQGLHLSRRLLGVDHG